MVNTGTQGSEGHTIQSTRPQSKGHIGGHSHPIVTAVGRGGIRTHTDGIGGRIVGLRRRGIMMISEKAYLCKIVMLLSLANASSVVILYIKLMLSNCFIVGRNS